MRRYTVNGTEFMALDPGDRLPGNRIVVRYHDIDSLIHYEGGYRQKSLVVREQFWREIPVIAQRVRGLSDRLKAIGIPVEGQLAERESREGAKLPSLRNLTVKFLRAVEAPPPSISEQVIVRAVREHVIGPEQPVYDVHRAMIEAIQDLAESYGVDAVAVERIVDEISLESKVMQSRQTGAVWAEQHLASLRRGGLLDWFMIDVKPVKNATLALSGEIRIGP
jgi:DNA-binding transcriptional regulator YhcF (GntR family)